MPSSKLTNRGTIVKRPIIQDGMMGRKNHRWKNINPSYSSVHKWLSRNYQKVCCEYCGGERFLEWSLKREQSHNHSRDNYLVLCSSCHKFYDYTEDRRKKLSKAFKGRKITWNTRPKK